MSGACGPLFNIVNLGNMAERRKPAKRLDKQYFKIVD